jgi:hypothetical protein
MPDLRFACGSRLDQIESVVVRQPAQKISQVPIEDDRPPSIFSRHEITALDGGVHSRSAQASSRAHLANPKRP